MQQQKWHGQASFFLLLPDAHTGFYVRLPYRFYFYLVAKLRYLIKKKHLPSKWLEVFIISHIK